MKPITDRNTSFHTIIRRKISTWLPWRGIPLKSTWSSICFNHILISSLKRCGSRFHLIFDMSKKSVALRSRMSESPANPLKRSASVGSAQAPPKTTLSIFSTLPPRRSDRTSRLTVALARPFASCTTGESNSVSDSSIDDLCGTFGPERYMSLPPCSRSATKAIIAVALKKGLDNVAQLEATRRDCQSLEIPEIPLAAVTIQNTGSVAASTVLHARDPWFNEMSNLLLGRPVSAAVKVEIDALTNLEFPPSIKMPAPYAHIPPEAYSLEHVYGFDMSSTCEILPRTVPSKKAYPNRSITKMPHSLSFALHPRHQTHCIAADGHLPTSPMISDDPFHSKVAAPPHANRSRPILDVFLVHDDATGKVSIDWNELHLTKPELHEAERASAVSKVPIRNEHLDPTIPSKKIGGKILAVGLGEAKKNFPRASGIIPTRAGNISEFISLDESHAPTTGLERKDDGTSFKRGSRLAKGHVVSAISKVKPKGDHNTSRRSIARRKLSQGAVLFSAPASVPGLRNGYKSRPVKLEGRFEECRENRPSRPLAAQRPLSMDTRGNTPRGAPMPRRRLSFSNRPEGSLQMRQNDTGSSGLHSGGTYRGRRFSSRLSAKRSKRIEISSSSDDDYDKEADLDVDFKDEKDEEANIAYALHNPSTGQKSRQDSTGVTVVHRGGTAPLTENAVAPITRGSRLAIARPRLLAKSYGAEVPRKSGPLEKLKAHRLPEVSQDRQLERKQRRKQVNEVELPAGTSTRKLPARIESNLCQHDPEMAERLKRLITTVWVGLDGDDDSSTLTGNRIDEVAALEKMVSGPESNSSPDISDLEREHGEGYIPDIPIMRGIFRQCSKKGLTLDEVDQFNYTEEVHTYYHDTRCGPEYTPNVASVGQHFFSETLFSNSQAWKWHGENAIGNNSCDVIHKSEDEVIESGACHEVHRGEAKKEQSLEVVEIGSGDEVDFGSSSKSRGISSSARGDRQHSRVLRSSSRKAALRAKQAIKHDFSDDSEEDDLSDGSSSNDSNFDGSDPNFHEELNTSERTIVQHDESGEPVRSKSAWRLYERVCGDMIHTMSRIDRENVLAWADEDFTWFEGAPTVKIRMQSNDISCGKCPSDAPGTCEENIFLKLGRRMSWRKIRCLRHRAKNSKRTAKEEN